MTDLKITTALIGDNTSIKVSDISNWDTERNDYATILFWSNDDFDTDFNRDLNNKFGDEWIVPTVGAMTYNITLAAIPKYVSGNHAIGEVLFNPEVSGNTVENKIWKCLTLNPVGVPVTGTDWLELTDLTASEDLFDYVMASTPTIHVSSTENILQTNFSVTKSGTNLYKLKSPLGYTGTYVFNLYDFNQYINNGTALLVENGTSADLEFSVSDDGIYVVVIQEGERYYYIPVYSFDSLRMVMKAVLKKVLCPEHLSECSIEIQKQYESDRLFITRVFVAFGTMMGMIHSEQVDHYHYFNWDESRLAALQRVDDILQKTLLMFADYNYELPCNCHTS